MSSLEVISIKGIELKGSHNEKRELSSPLNMYF